MGHPVGTGAYQLKEWTRGQKIVLEANPAYRDEVYPTPAAGSEPGDAAIAKGLAGQRLPLAGRVEINIVEEAQPRLLLFDSGKLDYQEVPASVADLVLANGALKPEYAPRHRASPRDRAGSDVYLLQHGRCRRRRFRSREGRASSGDRPRLRPRGLHPPLASWTLGEHPYGNVLAQPWLRGFKPDPLLRYQWKFYDVAPR